MIYFDHAATSLPKPETVGQAMVSAINKFGNPSRSAHAAALTASRCIAAARMQVAGLFHSERADRVVFTKNVTEALNIAVASVGGHIVTTEAEHNSVLRPVFRKSQKTIVPVDDKGRYKADDIAAAVKKDTEAVVIAHASNLTGNIAPIKEIGELCKSRGVLFIVDAAQSAGLVDINMNEMHIDALCFTGHKSLYGPQGTGGMCLSEGFTPDPLMIGGSGSHSFDPNHPKELPDRLEAGTLNAHGIMGLSAGLAYIEEKGMEELQGQASGLSSLFYNSLKNESGILFYGDYDAPRRAPIVTINIDGLASDEAAGMLYDTYDIAVRSGIHCAPLLHQRFGTEKTGAVRFSFSHMNTCQEVLMAAEAVKSIRDRFIDQH